MKSFSIPQSVSALIFDVDGTIIDNMAHHHRAWQRLMRELGFDWSLEEVEEKIWGKNEEIFERLFPGKYTTAQARDLTRQKELWYIESFRPHIALMRGLPDLLGEAKERGIKLGLATAAPSVCVEFAVSTLALDTYFEVIVQADDVKMSKPHPETFLAAAARLGVAPEQCLVFDDAPVGVTAADATEIDSVVLLTSHSQEEFARFINPAIKYQSPYGLLPD
jgi:HAD superfamily hydrolase (TIGR01509 family)